MEKNIYIWTDVKENKHELTKEETRYKMKEIISTIDIERAFSVLNKNGIVGMNDNFFELKK